MQSIANNPALRSHFDTQVNFYTELMHRTCDATQKLSELNLQLAQQLISEAVDTGRQLLGCTDPFQAAALAARQAEPMAQHLRSYQQQLMSLIAGAQVGFTQAAETHIPQAGRSAAAVADELARRGAEAGNVFAGMQRQAADAGTAAWTGPNGGQQRPH